MSSGDDEVIPMSMCKYCDHLVPESNLAIHEARCQHRKRPARETETNENNNSENQATDGDEHGRYNCRNTRQHRSNEQQPFLPRASWERPRTSQDSSRRFSESDEEDANNLSNDDSSDKGYFGGPPVAAAAAAAATTGPPAAAAPSQRQVIDLIDDAEGEAHWSCPRCTLENPVSSGQCDACSYLRPESERPPDRVRRERLVGGPQPTAGGGSPGSPGLIGGAVFGGLLGGSIASLQGQPFSSGILNGALSGAMGGAMLDGLARNDARMGGSPMMRQQQTTFSSSNGGRTAHSSTSVFLTPDGRMQVIRSSGGGAGAGAGATHMGRNPDDELNQMLLALLGGRMGRAGPGMTHVNPDHMSYEQLLQAYGNGSENLGAEERQIRSLPSSTIEDVDRLPADSRQCSICLEDFKEGDKRKIMPCLHGFHADCVDKWLRSNGSCPICKHRLES